MTDSIDVGKAVTHLFDDKDWIGKTIVGGLLALVPILGLIVVAGYEVRLIRNVSRRQAAPMPAWDDIGQMFTDGLGLGVARIILGLPTAILIIVPIVGFYFTALFGAILSEGSNRDFEQAFSTLFPLGLLASGLCCGLGILYGLILGFVFPAVAANYARCGTFASCFNLSEILGFIRRNPGSYLLVWVTGFLAGIISAVVISFVNFIPCLNLLLVWPAAAFATFWGLAAVGHATGQLLALDGPQSETGLQPAGAV